jgi:hypothetical protein
VLHAAQDGPVEINTGRGDAIVDLLSGEGLGRGPKTAVPLSKGDTRILRIGE